MSAHALRARYVELEIHDEDQSEQVYGPSVLIARTQDGEKIPFDKDVLQATYVPVHSTSVDFGEGMG